MIIGSVNFMHMVCIIINMLISVQFLRHQLKRNYY
jgi:hypothetical protein